MKSVIPLFLLFVGEAIYIWSEIMIAFSAKSQNSTNTTKLIILATVAGLIIIAGYYYGYKFSKNIWLVTATSISASLIVEPLISWFVFHELPNRGAIFGLIFGILGIFSTIFL